MTTIRVYFGGALVGRVIRITRRRIGAGCRVVTTRIVGRSVMAAAVTVMIGVHGTTRHIGLA